MPNHSLNAKPSHREKRRRHSRSSIKGVRSAEIGKQSGMPCWLGNSASDEGMPHPVVAVGVITKSKMDY